MRPSFTAGTDGTGPARTEEFNAADGRVGDSDDESESIDDVVERGTSDDEADDDAREAALDVKLAGAVEAMVLTRLPAVVDAIDSVRCGTSGAIDALSSVSSSESNPPKNNDASSSLDGVWVGRLEAGAVADSRSG